MTTKLDKLWFDDIRTPPDDTWLWARTIEDAKLIVNTGYIRMASIDHDLGLHDRDPADYENSDVLRIPDSYKHFCGYIDIEGRLNGPKEWCQRCQEETDDDEWSKIDEPTGLHFAEWLIEVDKIPPKVIVHSMNPVGAANIGRALAVTGKCEVVVKSFQRY